MINDNKILAAKAKEACLQDNNQCAVTNRRLFNEKDVLVVNVMSAPAAGKTSLLAATIEALEEHPRISLRTGVIAGDIETDLDFQRYREIGANSVQVRTGCEGHLDAKMVCDAAHRIDLEDLDILFIENVGNLVCPANFDLGHHQSVALMSVTDGDEKPLKYPAMFRTADLVLLSKADLLDFMDDFDPRRAESEIRALGNQAPVLPISVRSNEFFGLWINWLLNVHEARADGEELRPRIHKDGLILHAAE